MKIEDVNIGMKVVPTQRTMGDGEFCKKAKYYYVQDIEHHNNKYYVALSQNIEDPFGGEYFSTEDFYDYFLREKKLKRILY